MRKIVRNGRREKGKDERHSEKINENGEEPI